MDPSTMAITVKQAMIISFFCFWSNGAKKRQIKDSMMTRWQSWWHDDTMTESWWQGQGSQQRRHHAIWRRKNKEFSRIRKTQYFDIDWNQGDRNSSIVSPFWVLFVCSLVCFYVSNLSHWMVSCSYTWRSATLRQFIIILGKQALWYKRKNKNHARADEIKFWGFKSGGKMKRHSIF